MKRLPEGAISQKVSQFLFWYRLTPHSTTGVPPAELLLGRRPRSKLDFLKPSLCDTMHGRVEAQKRDHHDIRTKMRSFDLNQGLIPRGGGGGGEPWDFPP